MVRVWDAKSHNIVRVFKHAKGNLNAMLIIAFLLALVFFFCKACIGFNMFHFRRFVMTFKCHCCLYLCHVLTILSCLMNYGISHHLCF